MPTNTQTTLKPLQRLFRLFRQYRRETRYILLYALVAGLINLSLPLGVQAIIGLIAGGAISASWGVLVFFVVIGALFTGLLRVMQLSIMEYLQRRIFMDASLEFAIRIPRLDLEQLNREHLPELVNRFFDTINLQKGLPKLLIDGSTAILSIVLSMTLLSLYHPTFVTIAVMLLLLLFVLFYFLGPLGLQTSLAESKYKYKLAYWLEEVGRVAYTFKLGGANRLPVLRADELTAQYLDARAKHWRVLVTQFVGGLFFRVIVLGSFLVLGSILVMNNELNLGQFVASEILVLFIIDSVEKLVLLFETGYDVLTATEKLGQVTDLPLEKEGGMMVEEFCSGAPMAIEARNMSYKYRDAEKNTLDDMTFSILPGERIAFTGYNGSGKSTLMQVLSALRQDYTGTLLYNQFSSKNINLRSLRHHIGDVSSQEDLFKGSILENISLGSESLPLSKILQITELVGLNSFIQETPNGIETQLLPGGKNLPGNVVSKMLVARSIVNEPELLILEEPLINMNFKDRLRIGHILTDRTRPWTLVCATEDPVLASMCDRIYVLNDGKIIFEGAYSELMNSEHGERIFRYNLNTGADEAAA